eukprot:scaffold602353_cov19-Prasinocladus_malaysianus.AAC.1
MAHKRPSAHSSRGRFRGLLVPYSYGTGRHDYLYPCKYPYMCRMCRCTGHRTRTTYLNGFKYGSRPCARIIRSVMDYGFHQQLRTHTGTTNQ